MFEKYEWIVVSKDRENDVKKMRRKIRSHAMKATAASRKTAAEGEKRDHEQNPGPLLLTGTALDPSNDPKDCDVGSELNSPDHQTLIQTVIGSYDRLTCASSIGSSMPLSGLDLLIAETGLNVLDLSSLTTVHMGQRASYFLTKQPSCLGRLISRRRVSYLSYVPARYGHMDCLDDAVRCVTVKARRVLTGCDLRDSALELALYGKALRSLQCAVSEFGRRDQMADVLCTVQVLSLFDLIQQSPQPAWPQHIAGASDLVRMKGPQSFRTDFEKLLLHSTAGPILCESFRVNQPSFLEEDAWQQLFRSFATTKPFARGGYMGINLLCIMMRMPRLMRDVSSAVSDPTALSPTDLDDLMTRIRRFRMDLRKWRAKFDALVLDIADRQYIVKSSVSDERHELLGGSLTLSILGCRMLSAISMDMVWWLEKEALAYAEQMVKLHIEVGRINGWAGFFLCQKVSIAQATLKTRGVWMESSQRYGTIERSIFKEWCEAIPRSCGF